MLVQDKTHLKQKTTLTHTADKQSKRKISILAYLDYCQKCQNMLNYYKYAKSVFKALKLGY